MAIQFVSGLDIKCYNLSYIMDSMVIMRPPSEAQNLLLPITLGCSHNKCTFCSAYRGIKFRIRNIDDVKADIDRIATGYGWSVRRVFLENGDALVCKQQMLVDILKYLNERLPKLERVSSYASPQNLLRKSLDDLKALRELNLTLLYLGVESGDDEMLKRIEKGVTARQIVEAGKKARKAGIALSVTIVLGLAGAEGFGGSAKRTAEVVTEIDPEFCGALTLMLEHGAPLYEQWKKGEFIPASPFQSLEELREIIAHSDFSNCFFTSNHASNYVPIRLRLPEQKEEGLRMLDKILATKDESKLKPEYLRAL
jgi:radical SAM superfamily enzyme YgiQ (UPF0313 family)